jgi:hypothetical protein
MRYGLDNPLESGSERHAVRYFAMAALESADHGELIVVSNAPLPAVLTEEGIPMVEP